MEKYLDDDRILIDIHTEALMRALHISPEEIALSEAVQARILELGARAAEGEAIPYEQLYEEVNEVAEQFGCEYGIPIPATGEMGKTNYLVMAPGVPLRHIIAGNQIAGRNEGEMHLLERYGVPSVNSWHVVEDKFVSVIDVQGNRMGWIDRNEGRRLRKFIQTLGTRMESHLSVEAEERAQRSLKSKITAAQWKCYVLNDCFLERSKRSDLTYIFRKGYPTLVLSHHGSEGGRCIAALCLHPMGFFQFTHAGLMTPTDEVICHLTMMRADEHKFWAKSGQWHVNDTRSGL